MIFRVYTLCWLALACADEINRVQASGGGDEGAVVFGNYELKEVATEPSGMPAQSAPATLKDVKFISKISATESLLITAKNVTWKYDEVADTLTKITYDGDKTYDSGGFVQSGEIEYGFSQHLLRLYVKDSQKARLVVTPSMTGTGEFSVPVHLEANLYDASQPPLMLYLDAETEDRPVPSVLMFTKGKDTKGKYTKSKYVLNSFAMICAGKGPSSVMLEIGDKFDLSATKGAAGIASDGRSFWVLTANDFALVIWRGCEQVAEKDANGKDETDAQGNVIEVPKYDYKPVEFKTVDKLSVPYRGGNANKLPLGIWIDVSNKEHPVIAGKIISISAEGKLLSADEPSAP